MTQAYDRWLRAANVPLGLLLAFGVATAAAFLTPTEDRETYVTPIGYFVFSVYILYNARGIRPVMKGSRPFAESLLIALSIGAALGFLQTSLLGSACLPSCSETMTRIRWFVVPFLILVAPFVETLIINGWIQTRVAERSSTTLGLVAASATFIAIHGYISVPLAIGGIAFSWLRLRTQSLGVVAIAHSVVNIAVLFSKF